MSLALATGETIRGVAGSATSITYTISGDEVTATGDAFKVLAQGQLASSIGTIYTVPASTQTIVKLIHLANPTAGVVTAKLTVNGTADANVILPPVSIPAGGFAVFSDEGWTFYNASGQRMGEGATGPTGATGADGADGVGIPVGGTTGQRLAKASNTDYDTEWVTPGSAAIDVQEGGSSVLASADALNFVAADFNITDEGSGVAGIALAGGGGGVASPEIWHSDNAPGGADDREFTEGTTIGTLTRVYDSGTPKGTWSETLDGLEWTHTATAGTELDVFAIAPGGGISVGDYVTVYGRYPLYLPNYMGIFLGFSNGTTYGTSNAVGANNHLTTTAYRHVLNTWAGFNSRTNDGTTYDQGFPGQVYGWRVKYEAANTWGLYIKAPGTGVWRKVQSNYSYTLTPTHVVFGVHMILSPAYSADNGAGIRLESMRINDP